MLASHMYAYENICYYTALLISFPQENNQVSIFSFENTSCEVISRIIF